MPAGGANCALKFWVGGKFWVGRKIRTTGRGGGRPARFPLDFLQQVAYRLLAFRRRSAEVNLGPASQMLLQDADS